MSTEKIGNEKYKQLESDPAPPPYYDDSTLPVAEHTTNESVEHGRRGHQIVASLKAWKVMRAMAIIQVILAVLAVICGSACAGTSTFDASVKYERYCFEGSGVWVGIMCTVAASLGVSALAVPSGRKCLLISYMIMSIISSVLCGILLIFSSIYAANAGSTYAREGGSGYLAILLMNVALISIAVISFVTYIVSCALICYNGYCCCRSASQTISVPTSNGQAQRR